MPITESERAENRYVQTQSALVLVVLLPGWIMDRSLYELGILPVSFALQVSFSALALFVLVGLFLVVRQYRARMREVPPLPKWFALQYAMTRLFVFGVFAAAVSGYLQGLYVAGRWLIRDVLPGLPGPNASAVGMAATVVVGGALFLLRLRVRFLYASLEMLTAVALAAHLAPKFHADDPLNLGFMLTFVPAALYLFVRGADNMHQALTNADKDLLLKALSGISRNLQRRRERK